MKKILTILVVIFSIFILCSCEKQKEDDSKIYLDKKFYEKSEIIKIKADEFKKINAKSYVVFTYNSYCNFTIPCDDIFKEVMDKYNLSFYGLPIAEMKKTFIYDTVKYAPSIVIIKNGKIIAYLDAESDEDLPKYQDTDEFEKWLGSYIHLEY